MPADPTLTHTLTVRMTPALRDRLTVAAEAGDETVGALVRRAVEIEVGSTSARALDPFAALSNDELAEHLLQAFNAQHSSAAAAAFSEALVDDLNGVAETAVLALNLVEAEGEHRRVERLAGLLRQCSGALLRGASRVKAMRACELAAAPDDLAPVVGERDPGAPRPSLAPSRE